MELGPATPILRIFDEAAARAFYPDWLGFELVFEHRFAPDMPLYMGLKRDALELHLSGHHGDTTPGTRVRFRVDDLDAFYDDLMARPSENLRPGKPCAQPWGERERPLTDPFGNRRTFHEPAG